MEERILKLLKERYLLEGETSWDDLTERVSAIHKPIKPLLDEMRFLPSTPTMANFDRKNRSTGGLSSCFPLSVEDNMESIGESVKNCMLTIKAGGGVGYIFSNLRSSRETVKGCNNAKAGGGLSFMRMYNCVLDEIQQGGRRRGAGMAAFDIDYGDIDKVIEAKQDVNDTRYSKFNISIRVPDSFYEKLKETPDAPHIIKFKNGEEHELTDKDGNIVTVRQLWDRIVHSAWACAEPGILNLDRMVEKNPVTKDSKTINCNPCSEFVHVVNSSCNLGSFNLTKYMNQIPVPTAVVHHGYYFDWNRFGDDIKIAASFMDCVIDENCFPTEAIARTTREVRPIGIGVMGLAHVLIMMGVPYSSPRAAEFAEELILFLEFSIKLQSSKMAAAKGTYPSFDEKMYLEANEKLIKLADKWERVRKVKEEWLAEFGKNGIRNSVCTSIAPTGSISFIANVSSGIEPNFAWRYFRDVEIGMDKSGKSIRRREAILDPIVAKWCEDNKKPVEELVAYLEKNNGSLQKCPLLSEHEQELFKIANELSVDEHLSVLAASSRSTSTSVSKTINLPNSITKEQMGDVYRKAWEMGIIGVTVYRDGCRNGILTTKSEPCLECKTEERPKELPAEIHHFKLMSVLESHDGAAIQKVTKDYFVAVAQMNGYPYEIFSSISNHTEPGRENELYIPKHLKTGKISRVKAGYYTYTEDSTGETFHITGKHTAPEANLINRLVSLGFRYGIPLEELVKQLGKNNALTDYGQIIIRYIKKYLKDGSKVGKKCECGGDIIRIEGCEKCSACGVSKCGG
jgi:ribonucleoside-diphosphate reductase alpha chain